VATITAMSNIGAAVNNNFTAVGAAFQLSAQAESTP
jgi:Flp pilus assembly pilin Flp